MPTPKRPVRRPPVRPGSPSAGFTDSILPSLRELLSLLAPFAGAAVGWWLGSRMGTVWHGLVGGMVGTGLGALIARRGAPEILP